MRIGLPSGRQRAQVVAFALALAASLTLILLPTGSSQTTTLSSDGSMVEGPVTGTTLIESQGRGVLLVLAVPLVLTLLPLLVPASARRATGLACLTLLAAGVLLAALSIGVWFFPALVAALVATVGQGGRPRRADAVGSS